MDGSFISMEAVRTLFLTKCCWSFKFLRRSSFFVTKIESRLKTNALRTTTEPIGDFSNIFNMVTTQERTLSRKLATASFLSKSLLCSALRLFLAVKPKLNSFFFCTHFPCPNQSFGDLDQTHSHLQCHASQQSASDF